jgi:hypothetical protein
MAKAFRETALSLIGIFQIYEVDRDLSEATAEALGTVFRRHLQDISRSNGDTTFSPLHALVDELERMQASRVG